MKKLKIISYLKPLSIIPALVLLYFISSHNKLIAGVIVMILFVYMVISSYLEIIKKKTISKIIAIPFNLAYILLLIWLFDLVFLDQELNISSFPLKYKRSDISFLVAIFLSLLICIREIIISLKNPYVNKS